MSWLVRSFTNFGAVSSGSAFEVRLEGGRGGPFTAPGRGPVSAPVLAREVWPQRGLTPGLQKGWGPVKAPGGGVRFPVLTRQFGRPVWAPVLASGGPEKRVRFRLHVRFSITIGLIEIIKGSGPGTFRGKSPGVSCLDVRIRISSYWVLGARKNEGFPSWHWVVL